VSTIGRQASSSAARGSAPLPEFDVVLITTRSGSRTVRVRADDAAAARMSIEAECQAGECDCPPEFCSDDVETSVHAVRQVVLDGVTLITPGGVALGTLYADDTLRRHDTPHA
jgi:hypothetical protein